MILGVDASNVRSGGGLSYLRQLLTATEHIDDHGFDKVVVWAGQECLRRLPERGWLQKVHEPVLDGRSITRLFWRETVLERRLADARCSVLFSPGGLLPERRSTPAVTMSRNMLPFDRREQQRFGLSARRARFAALRRLQMRSMGSADGVIFLTNHTKAVVAKALQGRVGRSVVIPHGIDDAFRWPPRPQREIQSYSSDLPFRLLYVSSVSWYKHQWEVAEAVASLAGRGIPVAVDFVGPAVDGAITRLRDVLDRSPDRPIGRYLGPVEFPEMPDLYRSADAFVFASTCENLPNALLEAMAAGLPVVCSGHEPMLSVLGPSGFYCEPDFPESIAAALDRLLASTAKRYEIATDAYEAAATYSWDACSRATFDFIAAIATGSS